MRLHLQRLRHLPQLPQLPGRGFASLDAFQQTGNRNRELRCIVAGTRANRWIKDCSVFDEWFAGST